MAAAKGNCYNPDGPPKKDMDLRLFEELCALQCTKSEIASCLKLDVDTVVTKVEQHYKEDYSIIYKRYSEEGKCSLRRHQYIQSKKNPTMAIWLGKHWLDQKEEATYKVDAVLTQKHDVVMDQISLLQSDFKIEDSKSIKEQRSEPETGPANA